jgi:hypothetical protein
MMASGSALAILGPFFLPNGDSRNRRSRANTSANRPPARPATRPVNLPTQSNP